jgi:acyl-CoA reductase-like NAD-dependent aldehyde dehydrogenase
MMDAAQLDWARTWLEAPKRLFIDGSWRAATGTTAHDAVNPANGQVIASLQHAGAADVDAAVSAARRAFTRGLWRQITRRDRARLLHRIGDVVVPSWRH